MIKIGKRFLAISSITALIGSWEGERAILRAQTAPEIRSSPPSASAMEAERLHVAVLFLTDTIVAANAREDARLLRACANVNDIADCKARESRSLLTHFLRVRQAPSFSATILGDLFLRRPKSTPDWQWSLLYRTNSKDRLHNWMSLVDWGYGPDLAGVRKRGEWIGLSGPPFEGDVWIYAGGRNVRGEASTIAGQVLELRGVRARSADGRKRIIASGSYFITHIDRAGVVRFREELDIDMPCGEDLSPPAVMPPTWTAPESAFFEPSGRPRFNVKYTKGC